MRKLTRPPLDLNDHHLDFGCGVVPRNPFRAKR